MESEYFDNDEDELTNLERQVDDYFDEDDDAFEKAKETTGSKKKKKQVGGKLDKSVDHFIDNHVNVSHVLNVGKK